jgi:hypothetical protein
MVCDANDRKKLAFADIRFQVTEPGARCQTGPKALRPLDAARKRKRRHAAAPPSYPSAEP